MSAVAEMPAFLDRRGIGPLGREPVPSELEALLARGLAKGWPVPAMSVLRGKALNVTDAAPPEHWGIAAHGREGVWCAVSRETRRRIWWMLMDTGRGDRVELGMTLTAIRCSNVAGSKIEYFARIY